MFAQLQPTQDSPFADVLGWIFVFFVVIWPLLRGVIEAARTRRSEFGKTIAEIKRQRAEAARRERMSEERTLPEDSPPPLIERRPPARRSRIPDRGDPQPRRLSNERKSAHRDLVGDPFDDSLMGRDLVPNVELSEVPPEDEVERDPTTVEPADAPHVALERVQGETVRPAPSVDVLQRMSERLTPWQQALVLRDVLGPPIALRDRETRPYV